MGKNEVSIFPKPLDSVDCETVNTMPRRSAIPIDVTIHVGGEGYNQLTKFQAPCGYSVFEQQISPSTGVTQPPTSSTLASSKKQQQMLTAKRQKMAMSIALQPGQQILMQAFMLYMSGSQLNMFSINVTSMAIITPLTAIFSIDQTFRKVQSDSTNDDDVLQIPKFIYFALNLAFLALGLYKMSSMRLLPTTSADWVSKIEWKEMVETTSIPPDNMLL